MELRNSVKVSEAGKAEHDVASVATALVISQRKKIVQLEKDCNYVMSVEFVDSLLCILKEMVLESRVLTVVMVAIEYGRVERYFKFQEKWIIMANMHLS